MFSTNLVGRCKEDDRPGYGQCVKSQAIISPCQGYLLTTSPSFPPTTCCTAGYRRQAPPPGWRGPCPGWWPGRAWSSLATTRGKSWSPSLELGKPSKSRYFRNEGRGVCEAQLNLGCVIHPFLLKMFYLVLYDNRISKMRFSSQKYLS